MASVASCFYFTKTITHSNNGVYPTNVDQEQVSRAETSNHIIQILWYVIIVPALDICFWHTVHEYTLGFCFVLFAVSIWSGGVSKTFTPRGLVDSCNPYTHNLRGCLTAIEATVWEKQAKHPDSLITRRCFWSCLHTTSPLVQSMKCRS